MPPVVVNPRRGIALFSSIQFNGSECGIFSMRCCALETRAVYHLPLPRYMLVLQCDTVYTVCCAVRLRGPFTPVLVWCPLIMAPGSSSTTF
jgi:hypothetical protein